MTDQNQLIIDHVSLFAPRLPLPRVLNSLERLKNGVQPKKKIIKKQRTKNGVHRTHNKPRKIRTRNKEEDEKAKQNIVDVNRTKIIIIIMKNEKRKRIAEHVCILKI